MGYLSSIEAPLSALITVTFLANSLYSITYKVVESNKVFDEDALDTKDMLMSALAIMSLIGIWSSRRAFGVFTLVFMIHTFFYSIFNLFHVMMIVVKSSEDPCRFVESSGQLSDNACYVASGIISASAVVWLIATTLASIAVYIRLSTTAVYTRSIASTDTSTPQLISRKSIGSEREVEAQTPRRIMTDIFV